MGWRSADETGLARQPAIAQRVIGRDLCRPALRMSIAPCCEAGVGLGLCFRLLLPRPLPRPYLRPVRLPVNRLAHPHARFALPQVAARHLRVAIELRAVAQIPTTVADDHDQKGISRSSSASRNLAFTSSSLARFGAALRLIPRTRMPPTVSPPNSTSGS